MSMALLKKNVALCSRLENLHLHFRLQFAFSHGISGKMFSNLRQLSVFSREFIRIHFFCSLALNTKNQFSNCVVEPHWEVGRVCSCKSWVTYCPPNHWNTHLHSCQSNPFLSWNPICHMEKKNKQTNRKIKIQLLQKIVRAFIRHWKQTPFWLFALDSLYF